MSNHGTRKPGSNSRHHDENEYLTPVDFGQYNEEQYPQDHIHRQPLQGGNSQNSGQYPQNQQLPQHYLLHGQGINNADYSQQPSLSNHNLDESNPSLIYDRTIKVAKANYADRGTHGVAGIPYQGNDQQNQVHQQQYPFSSSQMHLQMQQMLQQQQEHHQRENNAMMPPPNAALHPQSQQTGPYPSLVPGTLGSQQFFQSVMNDARVGGANSNRALTSTTQLIQALNAQLASQTGVNARTSGNTTIENQYDEKAALENVLVAVAGDASQLNNLNRISSNLIPFPANMNIPFARASGRNNNDEYYSGDGQNNANNEFPNDSRRKKRESPSQALHPSQLQLPHHGGGLLVSGAGGYVLPNSSLGMKSVAEDDNNINSSNAGDQTNDAQNAALYNATMMNALNNNSGDQIGGVLPLGTVGPKLPRSQLPAEQQLEGLQEVGQDVSGFDLLAAAQVAQAAQALQSVEKPGDPLTNPSEPAANSGLDNSEGNLIVRRGDTFKIPKKNMHLHPPGKKFSPSKDEDSSEMMEYTALSLLGQGTFAQVFHCIEKKTGQSVAIKIVKNKPAYTRQAAVEIDVFRKLNAQDQQRDDTESPVNVDGKSSPAHENSRKSESPSLEQSSNPPSPNTKADDSIIRLSYYFMHCSHLCLVFEMLGPNLYELLKKRQFRGLPIGAVRTLIRQAIEGIKLLGKKKVVHCDLKPENILMAQADAIDDLIEENSKKTENASDSNSDSKQWIKLIDFGSACFEGQTAHTYIQSRFYRSPEVLIGLPYDSAIDMWSLGCVAAELFLGLPILPGVHEHDQLGRILEMIGELPEWMLERGTKCSKFFKVTTKKRGAKSRSMSSSEQSGGSSPSRSAWEFKSRQEYINSLTEEEKQSKGGLAKLEQQPTNRYFKKKRLEDIVMHHGVCNSKKEKEQLGLFVHFLKGVLDPDPWKRWTAKQAFMHPFLTGSSLYRNKLGEVGADGTRSGVKPYDIHWVPPWDASICRRKLLVVQKTKDKSRRNSWQGRVSLQNSVPEGIATHNQPHLAQGIGVYSTSVRNIPTLQSPATSISSAQVTAMADAMSLNMLSNNGQSSSPPQNLEALLNAQLSNGYPYSSNLSASLGANVGMGLPVNYQPLVDSSLMGTSFTDNIHPSQLAAQQNLQAMHGFRDFSYLPQQPPQQPTFMGAQSFSGMYYGGMPGHYPNVEGDLGYALQRPGVFPISNDAVAMLQRQASSQSSLAYLAQQNALLSSSLSNVGSTPQHLSTGAMNFQHHADLLQQLGLQDQTSFDINRPQMNAGATTSLLAQQLADYSGSDYQHQQQFNTQSSNLPTAPTYSSASQMAGSYHGISGPMSLSSLPSFQSTSLGNHGGNVQDNQQYQQQIYLAQLNSELMNMQNQQNQVTGTGRNNASSDKDNRNRL